MAGEIPMSILSLLGSDSSATSAATTQMSLLLQQVAARTAAAGKSSTGATTTGTGTGSAVTITLAARQAAAAQADKTKDAATLASTLRAALDADHARTGSRRADLSALSGRALAIVALDETGQFSRSEVAGAKQELRARDRQSAIATLAAGPLTATTLASYSRDLLTARETMSAEERQLRAGNANLR
jgi:hypothetical protein